jgi:hypothetical protein
MAAGRSWLPGDGFTYNDPVIFLEDVAQDCRERGIRTVAVSAGYIAPEPRVEFFRNMDAANIDLKGFTDGFYRNLCTGRLAPVLETLEYLKHEKNCWFEITTLLIPGENDSPQEIEAESRWVMDRLGPDVAASQDGGRGRGTGFERISGGRAECAPSCRRGTGQASRTRSSPSRSLASMRMNVPSFCSSGVRLGVMAPPRAHRETPGALAPFTVSCLPTTDPPEPILLPPLIPSTYQGVVNSKHIYLY